MPPIGKKLSDARSVRLALGAQVIKTIGKKALGPTVRHREADGQAERNDTLESPTVRPTVRLAVAPNLTGANSVEHHVNEGGLGVPTVRRAGASDNKENRPALLVSYVYLPQFLENRARYHYRDWVLDSGAFSAHNSGTEIKLQDYIKCCKGLMESDPTLTEIFALDVIGDHKASLKNCEKMWKQGVPAIPCFHYGEPWSVLKHIAKEYPKIALGGCVGKRDKDKFAGQCFARVWPKRIHGFGFGSEKSLMAVPWHSVDATNWEIGPCKYGRWASFGNASISVRGSKQNLRAEVEWYLDLERRARERWKKEMIILEQTEAPSLRLAINGKGQGEVNGALGPSIKMAVIGARDKNDNSPFLKEQS